MKYLRKDFLNRLNLVRIKLLNIPLTLELLECLPMRYLKFHCAIIIQFFEENIQDLE